MKKSRASSDAIRYPPMNVGRTTHVPTATVPGDPGTLPNGGNAFDAEARQTIHRPDLFFVNTTAPTSMNTRPQTGDQFASMTPTSSSQAGTSLSSQLYPYHQQAYRHYTQPTQTQTTSPLQHDLPPGAYRPHPGPGYLSSNPYAQLQHPQSAQYSPPINHPYGPPVPPKPITYPHLTSPVIHNVQTPPHVVQNQYFRASTPPQNQVISPQQASPYLSSTGGPAPTGGQNPNFSNAHNYFTSPQQTQQHQYFPVSGGANYNQPHLSSPSSSPIPQSTYTTPTFTPPATTSQTAPSFTSPVSTAQDTYAAPSFTSHASAPQQTYSAPSFTSPASAPQSTYAPSYDPSSPAVSTVSPPSNNGHSQQIPSDLPGYSPSPTPPPSFPHLAHIPADMIDRKERLVESPVDDGGDELARAIAMSQSEVADQQKRELELLDQEEQDLARALAESLLTTSTKMTDTPFFGRDDSARPSSSRKTLDETHALLQKVKVAEEPSPPPAIPEFREFGNYDKWRIPGFNNPESPTAPPKSQVALGKRKSIAPLAMMPDSIEAPPLYGSSKSPDKYTSRRNSVSSTSSLPYARDEEQDGRDPDDGPPETSMPWVDAPAPPLPEPTEGDEPATVLAFDDETYARKLAAEEEAEYKRWLEDNKKSIVLADPTPVTALPLYSLRDDQQPWQGPSSAGPSSSAAGPSSPPPRVDSRPGPFTSFSTSSTVQYPALAAHRESDADTRSEISHHSGSSSVAGHHAVRASLQANSSQSPPIMEQTQTQPPPFQSSPTPSTSAPATAPPSMAATTQPASTSTDNRFSQASNANVPVGVLNPNQFLDRELLHGVSIGFKAPVISIRLLPMDDPMPNIISLPYARCPPLHLQSPNWMHLLRLMARLSGTRIEPTVEAMAISKTELKLRTVVQFVKPHPQSPDWRTILWFSIDHPIPPAAPGAHRYLSHNPNLLPWSYSLSPVPMILRDAADTHISKTYTIPPSQQVPLPNLPITFPNLALYFQAAIDHSRRHANDPNGIGKLGKMVQQCYPSIDQPGPEYDVPERRVRKILNNLGIRKKGKKGKNDTNNEETYQLVTPFVPDEWG